MQIKNNLSSIVVSSRIRLARNLSGVCFPNCLDMDAGYEWFKKITSAFEGAFPFKVYSIASLSAVDAGVMLEKHLISPKLAKNRDFGGVILSHDENISIMIHEEDHLRMQCILKGLALDAALSKLLEIDDRIGAKLPIAYDKTLGFLTACISNLGTGLRASVMLFLPALSISGKITSVMENMKRLGLSFRGVFGEESEENGYHFQISNGTSLGKSEREYVDGINNAVRRIIELETMAREELLRNNLAMLKDMVMRSYAILTGAYTISRDEFFHLIAQVKFGTALSILKFKDNTVVDRLAFQCLPNSLNKIAGKELGKQEEGVFRAEFLRKALIGNRVS